MHTEDIECGVRRRRMIIWKAQSYATPHVINERPVAALLFWFPESSPQSSGPNIHFISEAMATVTRSYTELILHISYTNVEWNIKYNKSETQHANIKMNIYK
jgi:hypothetical protein